MMSVVSAKVKPELVDAVKESGVPMSRILEAGLAYYDSLSEREKKLFILNYTPGTENVPGFEDLVENVDNIPMSVIGAFARMALALRGEADD